MMNRTIKNHLWLSLSTCFIPFGWIMAFLLFSEISFQYEIYVGTGFLFVLILYALYCLFAVAISVIALEQKMKYSVISLIVASIMTILQLAFILIFCV